MNRKKALELYTEAAHRGEPEAQFRLAMYHLRGNGGEELDNHPAASTATDTQHAKELLEKSVAGGCPQGMRELGQMHERGGLVSRAYGFQKCCDIDLNKAYEYYK